MLDIKSITTNNNHSAVNIISFVKTNGTIVNFTANQYNAWYHPTRTSAEASVIQWLNANWADRTFDVYIHVFTLDPLDFILMCTQQELNLGNTWWLGTGRI